MMNARSADDAPAPMGDAARIDIRHLTAEQLQQLGVSQLAYVKQVTMNGEVLFAIHAADGQPMAVAADRDLAVSAIQQHDMVPALVH